MKTKWDQNEFTEKQNQDFTTISQKIYIFVKNNEYVMETLERKCYEQSMEEKTQMDRQEERIQMEKDNIWELEEFTRNKR